MMERMITARIIRNLCMLRPLRLTVDETGPSPCAGEGADPFQP